LPLQRRIVDFYAERSGEKTIDALKEHYAITVSLHAIQSASHRASQRAKELNSESPSKQSLPADILITEVDGSMVPVIEFGEVEPGADHRKARQSCWKEIRLCTVTAQGRATTRYGVARGNPLEVGCMMSETCRFEGMTESTHIHGVADGAPWIADQFEVQFGTRHNLLIDFYHVCEYLSEAKEALAGSGEKRNREQWYEEQKANLLQGETGQVLKQLKAHCPGGEVKGSGPVSVCLSYLTKRREHLDYKTAREKDLPIGSGEVESGHRHILQQRLKIPGAWWLKPLKRWPTSAPSAPTGAGPNSGNP